MNSDELSFMEPANNIYDVQINRDCLLNDLFVKHPTLHKLLEKFAEIHPLDVGWRPLCEQMLGELGYVDRPIAGNSARIGSDLDNHFGYSLWACEGALNWRTKAAREMDGHMPASSPEWASEILQGLPEGDTLPQLVTLVALDEEESYETIMLGHFEGDSPIPSPLSLTWRLQAFDEDDDDAVFDADQMNDNCCLAGMEATASLEVELHLSHVKENGENVPFNFKRGAFLLQAPDGVKFWAYPDRPYYGQ